MKPSRAVLALVVLAAAPVASAAGQALPVSSGATFAAAPVKAAPSPAASPTVSPASPATAALFSRGARVRLRVPMLGRDKLAGTVVVAQGDSVVLDTVDAAVERRMFFPNTILVEQYRRVTLPIESVDSIEVSTGRSRWSGMRHSAKRGALFLGLLGAATFRSGDGTPGVRNFVGGYLNGAVVGFALGGAFGATRSGERWQSVPRSALEPSKPATTIAAK
ncbi:MAG TPA: hypothetical protein VKA84_21285 [Gemmatimonadaceae bacterium]|nr:hypothetical protein [Gemmatimonadaceae bacterium]